MTLTAADTQDDATILHDELNVSACKHQHARNGACKKERGTLCYVYQKQYAVPLLGCWALVMCWLWQHFSAQAAPASSQYTAPFELDLLASLGHVLFRACVRNHGIAVDLTGLSKYNQTR